MSSHNKLNRQQWDSTKLISLSKNLAGGYHPGFNFDKSDRKTDTWNTKKFIDMSRYLSSAYGVDF